MKKQNETVAVIDQDVSKRVLLLQGVRKTLNTIWGPEYHLVHCNPVRDRDNSDDARGTTYYVIARGDSDPARATPIVGGDTAQEALEGLRLLVLPTGEPRCQAMRLGPLSGRERKVMMCTRAHHHEVSDGSDHIFDHDDPQFSTKQAYWVFGTTGGMLV